jgi:hypothetical protein
VLSSPLASTTAALSLYLFPAQKVQPREVKNVVEFKAAANTWLLGALLGPYLDIL